MKLTNARLCLDCEELHDLQHCPVCGSETFAFVTRWVKAAGNPGPEVPALPARVPDASEHREQVDAYRQLLNPEPPSRRRGNFLASGALGLALIGLARVIWRAAPEPKKDSKPGN
jgi:hypothetical protein